MLAVCEAVGGGDSELMSWAKPRMALSGERSSWLMLERKSDFARLAFSAAALARFQLDVVFLQRLLETFALSDVARGGEHALQLAVAIVESGGVVGHYRFLAVPGARGQLIVGDLASAQHPLDAGFGPVGIGEVILERRADQFVARAAGERFHLLVDVGDDAGRVGGHQGVDIRFDQRARVELLVAQALIEQLLLGLHLLAGRIVGADQQIADDRARVVAQRRDRHDRRKAAAVLADIGQLIDVFDAARGLEDQRLEPRRDGGGEFHGSGLSRARSLPAGRRCRQA